ncbi:MAG TPA: hypothetical protein VE291_06640 [Terracidiphilus sp.]|jgi:CRP/FNR family transcriptional regulator|nr:hypothetical protein [Terracidiphilus sp.]
MNRSLACVGSTRETVTRTLSEFRSRRFVMLEGATLAITDPYAPGAIGGV